MIFQREGYQQWLCTAVIFDQFEHLAGAKFQLRDFAFTHQNRDAVRLRPSNRTFLFCGNLFSISSV